MNTSFKEDAVKREIISKSGTRESLHVTGADVSFVCPAEATERGWSVSEITVPRDAGPPLHRHPWDEGYYMIEGEIAFTVGDRQVVAKAGDFLFAPGGTPHAFHGASDHPARVLVLDVPAAAEDFFREVDREVKEFPRDVPKMIEIGRRHRLEFMH